MESQVSLGFMHEKGNGVPQSDEQAYIWHSVSLATVHYDGHKNPEPYEKELHLAAEKLTPEQLAAARQRAAELKKQVQANMKNP